MFGYSLVKTSETEKNKKKISHLCDEMWMLLRNKNDLGYVNFRHILESFLEEENPIVKEALWIRLITKSY